MANAAHNTRPNRESLSKRLGKVAKQIKARDGHSCVYCGVHADKAEGHMHLDHLLPKSDGGLDVATNLVVACRRCNSARQNMTLRQWTAYAAVKLGLRFTPASIRAQARKELN